MSSSERSSSEHTRPQTQRGGCGALSTALFPANTVPLVATPSLSFSTRLVEGILCPLFLNVNKNLMFIQFGKKVPRGTIEL